jgi:hypothetical protein
MSLRKASISLAATISTLAATSAIESASAQRESYATTNENLLLQFSDRRPDRIRDLSRTPQPGATSRPSNRDMRGTPSMGGRAMRGGMGRR